MSNTVIQIKRSLTSSQPPSLNVAELAYSYVSNTIFIGTPDGTGTIAIGGKRYLDVQNNIYNIVNSAFTLANTTGGSNQLANQAGVIANASFDHSNLTYTAVNSAFGVINAAYTSSNANYVLTNSAFTVLNAAYTSSNANYVLTNAAFTQSNTDNVRLSAAYTSSNAGYTVANAAYGYANASNSWANVTFVKLTAPQQTITGDLAVTGNLTFLGNSTVISSAQLSVGDSLIYLAANNYSGTDLLDIGFIANYGNTTGANVHTGLVRDATDKTYYLFNGYDKEPANNTFVPYGNNMSLAVLNADLITSNLVLGGANAIVWIKSAYDNSNGGFTVANDAFGHSNLTYNAVNSAFAVINAAYTSSNAAYVSLNAAYTSSNAAYVVVNAAFTQSNTDNVRLSAAYVSLNAAYIVVNSAYTVSNAGFNVANAASIYAIAANAYLTNTFSSAANISSGTLPSGRLTGSYTGITGVGTITTGTWNGSTVNVGYGGTGIVSATLNGVVFGGGGNAAFQVTAAGTEGQVLTASATGVPQFQMLSGGTFMYY
jgi:hypothetical protein